MLLISFQAEGKVVLVFSGLSCSEKPLAGAELGSIVEPELCVLRLLRGKGGKASELRDGLVGKMTIGRNLKGRVMVLQKYFGIAFLVFTVCVDDSYLS